MPLIKISEVINMLNVEDKCLIHKVKLPQTILKLKALDGTAQLELIKDLNNNHN